MPVERTAGGTSLIDVLDRVLDKGIVIDAWVRVSLVGIDLITVEARVVVASIDTYLKYSEAVGQVAPVARPVETTRSPEALLARTWPSAPSWRLTSAQLRPTNARAGGQQIRGRRTTEPPPPPWRARKVGRGISGGRVLGQHVPDPDGAAGARPESLMEAKLGLLEFLIAWDDPREVVSRSLEWLLEFGGVERAACSRPISQATGWCSLGAQGFALEDSGARSRHRPGRSATTRW